MKNIKSAQHHFRLDDATERALEEICRFQMQTKSAVMRRYVQEGVAREAKMISQQISELQETTEALRKI